MSDPNQPTTNQEPEVKVDERAITRKSIWDGAKKGMMNGMKWGGIGGLLLSGVAGYFAFSTGKSLVRLVLGGLGAMMGAGWIGAAAGTVLGLFGLSGLKGIAEGGAAGIGLSLMQGISSAFLTIGVPILAASAVIGGVIGAVKGYNESDKHIEQAKREEQNKIRMLKLKQAQLQRDQQKLAEAEAQLNNTKQGFLDATTQIGYFSPGSTPNGNNNNELGNDKGSFNNLG